LTPSLLRRFTEDRRGNVAMMFAFALVPLVVLSGGAIDFTQAARVKDELQAATDTAALAVARDGLGMSDSQLTPAAKSYIDANFHGVGGYKMDKVAFDRATVTATVDTSATVPTTFLRMIGMSSLGVKAHAQTKGLGFEIAMVLDTSGSMAESAGSGGAKINALKDAAKSLFDILYADQTVSNRFKIGIVPFAAGVNVGPNNSSASWLDTGNPVATPTGEDFNGPRVNPFTLLKGGVNGMKNVGWGGCVMTRAAPFDIDDTAPGGVGSTNNTYFSPWFAPDEPDYVRNNTIGSYSNNYLPDNGGTCTGTDADTTDGDRTRQGRTCKYKNAIPDTTGGKGPNFLCNSQPILPLTSSRAPLDAEVNSLSASGNTNIFEGFMWGWRVLSPTVPFTEGKAYGTANNRKVIIMMTDGQNNPGGAYNANLSNFFASGFAINGHLAKTYNNDTLAAVLDSKTVQGCNNAKAKGIIVYSIAFGADAAASQNLLKSCASDAAHFFAPQNSSDLKPTFIAIAQSINALRIAQ
jgi:Flp pilus assembly protein TadG